MCKRDRHLTEHSKNLVKTKNLKKHETSKRECMETMRLKKKRRTRQCSALGGFIGPSFGRFTEPPHIYAHFELGKQNVKINSCVCWPTMLKILLS